MTKFIHTVTVTGADDSVSVGDLLKLQDHFPFVEFGILLSADRYGSPRFPSHVWLGELTKEGKRLMLSGHLCGQYVRDFLYGMLRFDAVFGGETARIFDRWQINTHGLPHGWHTHGLMNAVTGRLMQQQDVIFQYDNANTNMIHHAVEHTNGCVSALFDLSHGAGVLPESWPSLEMDIPLGYAGGLSPDNLEGQIEGLLKAAGRKRVWIDAETHLRSHNDNQFDLALVERFLLAAQPYVIEA